MMNINNKITTLYERYKNTPKKLKIICDWDEVIQACEPYALYDVLWGHGDKEDFPQFFQEFWWLTKDKMVYSPYGSHLNTDSSTLEKQQTVKNSPNFYQEAPFLTIAEDLLKLIKEDKIEKLIFLSAYDERKFSDGDQRKIDIFNETFRNFWIKGLAHEKRLCWLELIPFDNENQGQSKADWIKENASDFDLVIDDNPNICKDLIKLCDITKYRIEDRIRRGESLVDVNNFNSVMKIIAPCYPAVENQHDEKVLLVKQKISNLKKENF